MGIQIQAPGNKEHANLAYRSLYTLIVGLKTYSQKNTFVTFLNLFVVRKPIADEICESKFSTGFT